MFQDDIEKLQQENVYVLFVLIECDMYFELQEYCVLLLDDFGGIFEGEFWFGFFVGVCMVVMKLMFCVQLCVVVFGKKDYQQLMIVCCMCQQFVLLVEIIVVEIVWDEDGFVLLLCNCYLMFDECREVFELVKMLQCVCDSVFGGECDFGKFEQYVYMYLVECGWVFDYIVICCCVNLIVLSVVEFEVGELFVVFVVVKFGVICFIDNLEI